MKTLLAVAAGQTITAIGWNVDTLNIVVNAVVSIATVWLYNVYQKSK